MKHFDSCYEKWNTIYTMYQTKFACDKQVIREKNHLYYYQSTDETF